MFGAFDGLIYKKQISKKKINQKNFIMIFYKSSWKLSWSFLGNNKLIKIILFSKTNFLLEC
jgi:hypothetical protein